MIAKKSKNLSKVRRSPFFYVGDKYKLIPQIKQHFPNNINKFIEPFCGGGSVFLNVKADRYLLNDIDSKLIELHVFLLKNCSDVDAFWNEIILNIKKYDLSATFLDRHIPDEIKKEFKKTYIAIYNKSSYLKMREDYNIEQSNYYLLYLLLIYGFNRMLRFNSKGKFNLPVGNVDFNHNVVKSLNDYFEYVKNKSINFFNLDFEDFLSGINFELNDFLYLDPPYLISFSEYNKFWNEDTEIRLIKLLDKLNERGIKFAVSNILWHRKKYNGTFNEWAQKYSIVNINSNYISYHDNTEKNSIEVLVKNY